MNILAVLPDIAVGALALSLCVLFYRSLHLYFITRTITRNAALADPKRIGAVLEARITQAFSLRSTLLSVGLVTTIVAITAAIGRGGPQAEMLQHLARSLVPTAFGTLGSLFSGWAAEAAEQALDHVEESSTEKPLS